MAAALCTPVAFVPQWLTNMSDEFKDSQEISWFYAAVWRRVSSHDLQACVCGVLSGLGGKSRDLLITV